MNSAVIYARVSSVTDRQNTDRQVADLNAFANSNGYNVAKVFTEHISGAKKNTEREVLMSCFEYAITHKIDVILVSELSRLSRSIWETLEAVKYCKDNGIDIYFQKENMRLFDNNGEVNAIMAVYISCLSLCAEKERENIAYRLSSGRKLAIEKGVKMGRKVGYRKPKEDKQQQYKEVIKYLKKGLSVANVLKCCQSDGIKVSERTIWSLKREFC